MSTKKDALKKMVAASHKDGCDCKSCMSGMGGPGYKKLKKKMKKC